MNIFTNDDYRRIQAWLIANAIKDSDFAISENTVPDEDILVITQNMSTVPTNYRISIKNLLNSSLGKVVIDKIIAKAVTVNNVLTVDAANVVIDNDKGETLQDIIDWCDDIEASAKGWKIEYQDPQQDEPTVRAKYILKDYKGVPKGNVIKVYKDSAIINVYLGTTEDTCNPDTGEVTKKPVHDNNEALSIVYRLDTSKYMLVNVPLGIFTREAEFDKYRGLGIEPNGQVFVKLASDVESTNYLHFNSLGEIAADGIEVRILRDLGTLISNVAGDGTMWGQYKQEEGTQETSTPNDGSRWGEYKEAEAHRDALSNSNNIVYHEEWDDSEGPEWEDPVATEASYAYNWKTTYTPASDGKTEGNLKDLYQKSLDTDEKVTELERVVGDIELEEGGRIIGTSANIIPEDANPSAEFYTVLKKVSAGEKYEIKGKTTSTYYILWATGGLGSTSVRTIKRRATSGDATTPQIITIEDGETYLAINVAKTEEHYLRNVSGIQNQFDETEKRLNKNEDEISIVSTKVGFDFSKQISTSGNIEESKDVYVRRQFILSASLSNNISSNIVLGVGTGNYSERVELNSNSLVVKGIYAGIENVIYNENYNISSLSDITGVCLKVNDGKASISFTLKNGTYTSKEFQWYGGGKPYCTADALINLTYYPLCVKHDVWIIQDSYGNFYQEWMPMYYLINNGIKNWLGNNLTGATSGKMYNSFVESLIFGKPRIAVWGLGMNDNSDKNANTPDPIWLNYANMFKNKCNSLGIIPIYFTIPSVPDRLHDGKNTWIRNSGCRYVDVAKAVGANENGTWYEGMLNQDNIHPSVSGAKVIALELLKSLPEVYTEYDNRINDNERDINNIFELIDDITSISIKEEGGIITSSNTVGNVVQGSFKHIILDVKAGDTYKLHGLGGSSTLLWAFANSLNVITRKATENEDRRTVAGITLTAQECDAKLIINVNADATGRRDLTYVGNILDKVIDKEEPVKYNIRLNNGVAVKNNAIKLEGWLDNETYKSIILPCKKGDVFEVSGAGGYYRLFATAKEDGTIVRQALQSQVISTHMNITIEDEEKYITFNVLSAQPYAIYKYFNKVDNTSLTIAAADSSQEDKDKADYICNLTDNGSEISHFLQVGYKKIYLAEGTYNISSPVYLYDSNVAIIGNNATFRRTSGYMVLPKIADLHDIYIEGINFSGRGDGCVLFGGSNSTNWEVKNIKMDSLIIQHSIIKSGDLYSTSCGKGKDFESFKDCWSFAKSWGSGKIRIEVYGHHVISGISGSYSFDRPLELVGMTRDACLEYSADNAGEFVFADTQTYPQNRSIIRDMKFLRTGEMDAYNVMCVRILSSYCKFYNCVFQNDTSSPVAFNQATDTTGTGINVHGDRRHGCQVEPEEYENCETELHDCIGIGSPYGFKNTRGFYLYSGSPKMYGCKGIGGGIGERGYGIVCHRHSKVYMYDCVGIGSPYGYRLCTGIQFQANSVVECYHCIGKGGTGYQHISSGGRANYTNLNTISGASNGFGFIMSVEPKLVDCVGYAGDGEGSEAIYCEDYTHPMIVGGYYGKEIFALAQQWKKDSGKTYMTLNVGNDKRNCEVIDVYFENTANHLDSSKKIVLKSGDTVIAEKACTEQEMVFNISNSSITADTAVTLSILNTNGTDAGVADNDQLKVTIRYRVNNAMSCVGLHGNSYPTITNAMLEGNSQSDGVSVNTSSDKYLIANCNVRVSGYAVTSSTQRESARVANCVMNTVRLHNVTSIDDKGNVIVN